MTINTDVNSLMYSARDMAEMRLPGYPDTERAWLDRVKNGKWSFIEIKGKGRGGIKRLYSPPPDVLALIEARTRGELPASATAKGKPVIYKESPQSKESAVAPNMSEGMIRCGCGHLIGIQPDTKVRLSFTSPDFLTLMRMAFHVKETSAAQGMSDDEVYNLTLLAFSVLTLMGEGKGIVLERASENPDLMDKLTAFVVAYHQANHKITKDSPSELNVEGNGWNW